MNKKSCQAIVVVALVWLFSGRLAAQPAESPRPSARVAANIVLGNTNMSDGLTLVNQEHDGATQTAEMDGRECHQLQRYPGRPELYIYFQLDAGLKVRPGREVLVTVEYFDAAPGHFIIDYDGLNEQARNPAYSRTRTRVDLRGDQKWHRAAILVPHPRFERRQNGGGDFRLAVIGNRFYVRTVQLTQESK